MTCGPPSEHSPTAGDSRWSTSRPFFARGLGLAATMLERSALYSSRCEPNRIGSTELNWFVHAKGPPSRQASQRYRSKTDVLTRASPINAGVGGGGEARPRWADGQVHVTSRRRSRITGSPLVSTPIVEILHPKTSKSEKSLDATLSENSPAAACFARPACFDVRWAEMLFHRCLCETRILR